jgi:hypothetical protein
MFGLNAAINAMAKAGCKADWEIAYHNVPEDYRKKMSESFPFKVNWTDLVELNAETNGVADKYWIATWLMTNKVIDNYDAICHTQADHMPLSDMTALFKAAANDCFVITEHFNTNPTIEDLYKREDLVTHRGQCALTDQFIFTNKKNKHIFAETARIMDTRLEGDRNHPIIILNNLVKEHIPFEDVITLERHLWAFQKNLGKIPLHRRGDYLFTNNDVRLRGIHNRWWQIGRAGSEIKNNPGRDMSVAKKNWNIIRDYMAEMNARTPATKIENYEKTVW